MEENYTAAAAEEKREHAHCLAAVPRGWRHAGRAAPGGGTGAAPAR
jgi:hypothetical protein